MRDFWGLWDFVELIIFNRVLKLLGALKSWGVHSCRIDILTFIN